MINCAQCNKPIELKQAFYRVGHDYQGQMIVKHAGCAQGHEIEGERARTMTGARANAIETFRSPA